MIQRPIEAANRQQCGDGTARVALVRATREFSAPCLERSYPHSIVAGGLPEMSYTTRDTPEISLMMLREHRSRKS